MCREVRDDAQMARAGRSPSGAWYLGRGPGRGVWWCVEHGGESLSVGALARALRAEVNGSDLVALRALVAPGERR